MIVLVAFGALLLAASLIAARLLPEATRLERACGAAVLVPALAIGIVHVLGAISAIATLPWIAATLLVALAALAIGGTAAWAVIWDDLVAAREGLRQLRTQGTAIAAFAIGAAAVGLAAAATYLLVPWAWDSLGYHLPIVHDALQTGTLRHVPASVVYIDVYPRLIDVFFVAWRLSLGSDTWIELGQLPFALGGVIAIATIAERAGVPAWRGLALGALWLAVPVVMLELASAYVDVAVGGLALLAFALATSSARPGMLLIAGVAIGVLLGSKPSAPPIAAVAMATLIVRAGRAGTWRWGVLGCAVAAAIGVWKYVENIREWHNPIWPAHVTLGSHVLLPGKANMAELAASGLREPYLSQGWLGRLISSWTAMPDAYVYDMRIGGFGPLFTFALLPLALALPFAVMRSRALRETVRAVGLPVLLIVLATLASPGAFWARYTIAIPGALLALAIAITGALPARWRSASELGAVALTALGIGLSSHGFTDGGPSLLELARMSPERRISAHALDAQEADWQRARDRVGPGEAFGYDWSFGLAGRLWRSDGRGRVVFLDRTTIAGDELLAWARRERVRVVVLGEGPSGAADTARAMPEHFVELFRSDYPEWQPCAVFESTGVLASEGPDGSARSARTGGTGVGEPIFDRL
ncbi:MAG: hypothetical protein M3Y87_31095 [Myxococcota bacterium]|nr:hypothetical protein [Myxococcota bacterium]